MGSWGFKAFDSDSAGDFMAEVERVLVKPINKVNNTRISLSAQYHYDAARAAAMSLLSLAKETTIIGESSLEDAIAALDRMQRDEDWLGYYTKPNKVRDSVQEDIRRIARQLVVMRKRSSRILRGHKR